MRNDNGPRRRTGGRQEDQQGSGSLHIVAYRDPIALCRPERVRSSAGYFWLLIIDRCPWCSRQHTHGGGDGDEPFYGHRGAHCTDRLGDGYWLEPAAVDR